MRLIFYVILFFVIRYSLPLIINKNQIIIDKFHINIPDNPVKYFYAISALVVGIVIFCMFVMNIMTTQESVQAVNINNKVKGINISNNDGDLDLSSASDAGCRYVYLKATEGATFKDSYMDAYYNQCKNLGMKVGVYHYLVSTSSPEEQAKNFYDMISEYDWDLIPMLDVEVYFDGFEDYIKRFKTTFNDLSSMELGIYSYTNFIDNYMNDFDSEIYDMPLWEANYNGKPWSDVGNNNFNTMIVQKSLNNFTNE